MANKIEACLQICADWGLIPTEFRQCMTWEEQVLWLGRFLQTVIVPTTNQIITDFEELKTWVENYLDTTDFEQMVSDKLDEMAEDGTLGELIGQYIDDNYVTKTDYATAAAAGVVKVGDTLEIDNAGVLNAKPTPADFLSGMNLTTVRYEGAGGFTTVHYAIIPAAKKPTLKLAGGVLDTVEPVSKIAHDTKSTLAINAGAFDLTTGATSGSLVVDGEFKQLNYSTFATDRELLYMQENGRLDVLPYTATQAQIMALNPVWAVQGFYCYVYNYQNTTFATNNTDYAERTVIGQDIDGNYLVFMCEGRSDVDAGLNPLDSVNFCASIGVSPRILYNLDGGGSSQIVAHGVTVNQLPGDTGETRSVANALCWIAEGASDDGVFDAAMTVNNALVAERRLDIPFNMKPILEPADGVTITNLSMYREGSFIYIEGSFVTASSTATYGKIIGNIPTPAQASAYIPVFNSSTKATYLLYFHQASKEMRNGSVEALPAGTYYIRGVYRTAPGRTLGSGNN